MAQAKETGLQHFYMMELAPGLIIDARNKCVHLLSLPGTALDWEASTFLCMNDSVFIQRNVGI